MPPLSAGDGPLRRDRARQPVPVRVDRSADGPDPVSELWPAKPRPQIDAEGLDDWDHDLSDRYVLIACGIGIGAAALAGLIVMVLAAVLR